MALESSKSSFSFISRTELPEINNAIAQGNKWQDLWFWLGLPDPSMAKQTRGDDWWAISPFQPNEESPSFHMSAKGWYCFSTGQSGSFLNLVAELRGLNIYHAAHEVRESLLGQTQIPVPKQVCDARQNFKKQAEHAVNNYESPNQPIQTDLTKSRYFSVEDPQFDHRGIPLSVFQELGAGYLDRPEKPRRSPDHLNHRHVFQIRGVQTVDGKLQPVILSHMGRASNSEQAGKWWIYPRFQARYELYNIDLAILDEQARKQALATGHVVVVEGAFDVAKLYAAGIRNAVATFGKRLYPEQLPRFQLLAEELGINRFLIFYDRGQDGESKTPNERIEKAAVEAGTTLESRGFESKIFQWNRRFSNSVRQNVAIPEEITDPCEFSTTALRWFRSRQKI